MELKPALLVVGSGSAGQRHARNLVALGAVVDLVDPRPDRRVEGVETSGARRAYATLDEALEKARYHGAVVASPPVHHLEAARRLANEGLPLLLEKPLCPEVGEALSLLEDWEEDQITRTLMGYTYRWWPPVQTLREELRRGRVGKPLTANLTLSAHLADWHPWEDYREFFMSQRALGGGALLDESHFLDLMVHLFGWPEEICAVVARVSSLDIDADDHVDVLARYADGLCVRIHLDIYGRPHERSIVVLGEKGTLVWSHERNSVRHSSRAEGEWDELAFDCERNEMFLALARDFLRLLGGERVEICTLRDGVDAIQLVETCRRSSSAGRFMAVPPPTSTRNGNP